MAQAVFACGLRPEVGTMATMSQTLPRTTRDFSRTTQASVDITIPVLNEERSITSSLATLNAYLDTESDLRLVHHRRRQREHGPNVRARTNLRGPECTYQGDPS